MKLRKNDIVVVDLETTMEGCVPWVGRFSHYSETGSGYLVIKRMTNYCLYEVSPARVVKMGTDDINGVMTLIN